VRPILLASYIKYEVVPYQSLFRLHLAPERQYHRNRSAGGSGWSRHSENA
jgi:hypothetical protein